eukprot:CAMPEP_0171325146 /NCGR_PEP_ID=MMETSP0816-20121228/116624_1 /TAXON_ID=420281 /ORGANISM="Proboscia inermis, Strain CCAP1064/1" /LENGTH=140 /DNA_ID=CAMNT_0011824247 /DNA_START=415 /DNA_END=837 /DNA_ORIENTATION=-
MASKSFFPDQIISHAQAADASSTNDTSSLQCPRLTPLQAETGVNNNPIAPSLFQKGQVVSQSFRDSLACHIYMLFSVINMVESEAKAAIDYSSQRSFLNWPYSRQNEDVATITKSEVINQTCDLCNELAAVKRDNDKIYG